MQFFRDKKNRIRYIPYISQNNEAGTPFEPRSSETLEEQPHYSAGKHHNISDAILRMDGGFYARF